MITEVPADHLRADALTPVLPAYGAGSLAEVLPSGIRAEEHDDVDLRGFPGPLHVVQLTGHAAAPNDSDDDELWLHTGL